MVYIVMEYVRGRTLASLRTEYDRDSELQEKYEQIAKAIRLFLAFNIPDKTLLNSQERSVAHNRVQLN
jgi:hypothetical protein